MVALEQEHSPQEMRSELAEKATAIHSLQQQLQSSTLQKERMQQDFQVARDQYEAVIVSKNAEIEQLKTKVEKCKVCISNLEKTNKEQRARYECQILSLKEEVKSKEEEISRIKEDFNLKSRS